MLEPQRGFCFPCLALDNRLPIHMLFSASVSGFSSREAFVRIRDSYNPRIFRRKHSFVGNSDRFLLFSSVPSSIYKISHERSHFYSQNRCGCAFIVAWVTSYCDFGCVSKISKHRKAVYRDYRVWQGSGYRGAALLHCRDLLRRRSPERNSIPPLKMTMKHTHTPG